MSVLMNARTSTHTLQQCSAVPGSYEGRRLLETPAQDRPGAVEME
jgi:hypothetical protein